MKLRYLALGDSYTIGESVEISQRWPVQLVTRLRQEGLSLADPEIIAKTGWTTDDLLEAINKADPVGPFNLVSLLIGVNNQYRGRSDDDYRRGFIALLEKSIEMAGTNPAKVVVLSIPDWGVTPFARGRDNAKIAVEIDSFNAIAKEETERAGSTFVDITPVSRRAAQELRLLAGDGLHPSDSMYAEWVALALEPARKALRH
ncbi:MAG TPA: SGNH/GDSL hydrolase family protein [Thermoanaerobaculia bacterium]|nr:SGNH/GDSL hydrolase family protein [Thermoanaerobaculia bacterium]